VVVAGPVAADEVDALGPRLVGYGVVDDQDAGGRADEGPDLGPEFVGVGFQAVKESGERVVGRGERAGGRDAGRLGRRDDDRSGDEEVDVGSVGRAGGVHGP
jgi:hypothetical protein